MRLPPPQRIGIRAARADFGSLADRVATHGDHFLICRREQPLAALIPVGDLDRFRELFRRDEELAAVLRARGFKVQPWTTPGVLEAVSSIGEASR